MMDIIIKDIPEEGMDLHADSKTDGWFRDILADSLSDLFRKEDRGVLDIRLLRTGVNVDCRGELECGFHPICCRCLKVFSSNIDISIHLTLAPLYESERQLKLEQEEEIELVKEDLEFSFYEGDRFSFSNIVREQMILATPIQPLCKTSCKGLCQHCGKDLNEGPCNCTETHEDPRWAPLKTFKAKGQ